MALVAAGVSAIIPLYVWHRRHERAARPFMWLMIALGAWSLVYAAQLGFTTLTGQLAWQRIGFAAGGTIPTIWLLFSLRYAGKADWLTRPRRALLAVDPVLFALLTLTNPVHGLIWDGAVLTSTMMGPAVLLSLNVGYYLHITYAYLAIGAGLGLLLLVYVRATSIYRKQSGLLILGALLPSAANVSYTLRISWGPLPVLDPTPFAFVITGTLFTFALFRFDLLERTPIARQQVLEETGDGVIILDADGKIVETNPTARRTLDVSPSLRGSIADLDETGPTDEALQAVDTQTVTATVDGQERVYYLKWSSLADYRGETVGHVLALRDVTERAEYERQNERLEEFAQIVSHDLRSPLNVAEGRLALARAENDSEHLSAVADALDRMGEIVDETLTLARQGQIVADPETVTLADVLETSWRNVETAGADLTIADAPTIRGDPERLHNLFENLFRNAVEHGSEDVAVRVGCLDTEGGDEGFYVEDDGPGIPAEERDDVFDAGHSTADEGTGFGLAIVERIVEAHGWVVTVTDSEAGGARFEITGVEIVR
ncbi:MAG: histidine kinase N-terminal 7TM domain-containing protein [Halolamina sp.]